VRTVIFFAVIATSSACWQTDLRPPRRPTPTNETVVTTTERSHTKGALQGLGLGILVGGGVGAVVGYAQGDDPQCEPGTFICFRMRAQDKAMLDGLIGGGIGGIAGAIIGGIIGSETVVERRVTPVGPAGSTAGLTVSF
jgi:hypothetical protein